MLIFFKYSENEKIQNLKRNFIPGKRSLCIFEDLSGEKMVVNIALDCKPSLHKINRSNVIDRRWNSPKNPFLSQFGLDVEQIFLEKKNYFEPSFCYSRLTTQGYFLHMGKMGQEKSTDIYGQRQKNSLLLMTSRPNPAKLCCTRLVNPHLTLNQGHFVSPISTFIQVLSAGFSLAL